MWRQHQDDHENMLDIDHAIRSCPDFPSHDPLSYWCSVDYVCTHLMKKKKTTLRIIDRHNDRFAVSEDRLWVRVLCLTPFQGEESHRVFGHFACSGGRRRRGCGRKWQSAITWTNKWQKCQGCETKNYPFFQMPLEIRDDEREDEEREKKPHDMARCQKCVIKGSLCAPHLFFAR